MTASVACVSVGILVLVFAIKTLHGAYIQCNSDLISKCPSRAIMYNRGSMEGFSVGTVTGDGNYRNLCFEFCMSISLVQINAGSPSLC